MIATVENTSDAVSALIENGDAEAALGLLAAAADSLSNFPAALLQQHGGGRLTTLRSTLLSLSWNATCQGLEESASTIALRAATLELIVSEPSQVHRPVCMHFTLIAKFINVRLNR